MNPNDLMVASLKGNSLEISFIWSCPLVKFPGEQSIWMEDPFDPKFPPAFFHMRALFLAGVPLDCHEFSGKLSHDPMVLFCDPCQVTSD